MFPLQSSKIMSARNLDVPNGSPSIRSASTCSPKPQGTYQFIHVDPVKAAQTPFGSTIAHGFLSLSLIPKLMEDILILPEGLKMVVNYGLDSVRFIQPVKVNSKVRLKVELTEVTEKKPGQWLLKATATLEIEGSDKPAYIAEPLSLCFV